MTHTPLPLVPDWVPIPAQRYLDHTVAGRPIRALARSAGCHASTVLRQIRRIETRRDDPLVDAALTTLARVYSGSVETLAGQSPAKETSAMRRTQDPETPSEGESFDTDALTVLRRLCEPGSVLAVAEQMEKAVVVRGDVQGEGTRTAVVDVAVAQAMALNDWIACATPGRICRYRITGVGRSALQRMLAAQENRARTRSESGMAEAQAPYAASERGGPASNEANAPGGRGCHAESPLFLLARRKDRDGQPFLDPGLVRAGERLREDFELAQVGPRVTQNWDRFLTGPRPGGKAESSPIRGPGAARERVIRALDELGPGLSDVALRCCCYMEGLEQAEKRLGWSARSGKIVLRIALQRLEAFYDGSAGTDALIG
ncbi:MAG: DUF6456 domain-containing protein [Antarcticimicrobium sp.]|uniref:DUF6456 domain-containing protein n=1 Tax=Antarcticimicrobium sp. TaxID=2824147 RepID=UPI002608B792|nr:DUF6456 domain-containing protein [Antarcticimicrobium sp.]MDF1718436.1 DUF6456 domain-containing protein [Antarcticimicrobium sp.]